MRNNSDGHEEIAAYNYEFRYCDLCYAVAKAMTAVIKDYGFYGYYYSTSDDRIIIHELINCGVGTSAVLFRDPLLYFLIDKHNVWELIRRDEYSNSTNFSKELELLLSDM